MRAPYKIFLSAENYLEMIENVTRQMDVAYENYQRNEEKSDEGLVPMLRTGMIALQLLPSNCLAGVVVFTDGCTDVYVDQERIMKSTWGIHVVGKNVKLQSFKLDSFSLSSKVPF